MSWQARPEFATTLNSRVVRLWVPRRVLPTIWDRVNGWEVRLSPPARHAEPISCCPIFPISGTRSETFANGAQSWRSVWESCLGSDG